MEQQRIVRRIARLKGVTEMENLFAENIPDAKVSVEIQISCAFDITFGMGVKRTNIKF